jgi:hypothetical protein
MLNRNTSREDSKKLLSMGGWLVLIKSILWQYGTVYDFLLLVAQSSLAQI